MPRNVAESVGLPRTRKPSAAMMIPTPEEVGAAIRAAEGRIVRDKVGIPYRLHDLRHFFASGLIAAGCDVVAVQRALGHSSASITLTAYSHLWPEPTTGPARPRAS